MKTIAKINGKEIKTDGELLQTQCESLPYLNYVQLDEITSIAVLEECLGMIEEYKYHIDDMIDNIKERISDIESENDDEEE